MKRILGLDLGTTSIGWALVNEAESSQEKSSIVKLGVRVNPLTTDELQDFEKGKSITTNADRTLKRSARRNLQRYKQRKEALVAILTENGFIGVDDVLTEKGNRTTFETYRLRAKAVTEEISLAELARVLLMINKKRGYKSSRKAKDEGDGRAIDGMELAKKLYDEDLTPGELSLALLTVHNKKKLPDFYRSDLQAELDRIWEKQREYRPEMLSQEAKDEIAGKNEKQTWAILAKHFKWTSRAKQWNDEAACTETVEEERRLEGLKPTVKGTELKIRNCQWRVKALSEQLDPEQLAVVIQEINGLINGSSGYLGAIGDRSKQLYFKRQTVGQYLMAQLTNHPGVSLRNIVFYRQDYLDEFERIWERQALYHPELTPALKAELRDTVIFYQRRLKSQKGLVGFCEFERKEIEVERDGKVVRKVIGTKVIPRSHPLFQTFKIWQTINNIEVFAGDKPRRKKKSDRQGSCSEGAEDALLTTGRRGLYQEEKERLAHELSVRDKMTKAAVLNLLFDNAKALDMNFKEIEGNQTNHALFAAFSSCFEEYGYDPIDFKRPADEIYEQASALFNDLHWNEALLSVNLEKPNKELQNEPYMRLWHLLYSFESDNSQSGKEKLIDKLQNLCGMERPYAAILSNVTFADDYGSLSAKAIQKILPHLKEGNTYDVACAYAGYRHSAASLTKEEIENKVLREHLDVLPKNSLRNPVVEKILNQMVNVVNAIIDAYGRPDEIRVELARELKKNAKEREDLTKAIAQATKESERIRKILADEFGLSHISRNDIIRYRLYEELAANDYKTLYSNRYVPREMLFSKEIDIEHIIPQARLFDDSFSNKTLEYRSVNLEKGSKTAFDYVREKYGDEGADAYRTRCESLFKGKSGKLRKLLMTAAEIPDDFIDRDLRNTQYIAKHALAMLNGICRRVVATTGSVTDELRADWQLVDVMKELNFPKYEALGLVESYADKDGRLIRRIKDWNKRNDHRHHAMDALTVAFTKDAFIQFYNNKNASLMPDSKAHDAIRGIKTRYFENGIAVPPIPLNELRAEAKRHLSELLVSVKAKNKVFTYNVNRSKTKNGELRKLQQTPRGRLHEETIYGSRLKYITKEEKVNASFDAQKIATVGKATYRAALLNRLAEFDNDPKKAFTGKNSLEKNPLYADAAQTLRVPERVTLVTQQAEYTVRKPVDSKLNLGKVVDKRVRDILQRRLDEFEGNADKAFTGLDENPIWFNEKSGLQIKRVKIATGISNAEALHFAKDSEGKFILDAAGRKRPVDFVCPGNNHHVAIFRYPSVNKKGLPVKNEDGTPVYEYEEQVVTFYEAVARVNQGLPVIDKKYRSDEGREFLFSMKQNEYFVFPNEQTGFDPRETDLLNPDNYAAISPNLFRVQKFSSKYYVFRHHLETTIDDKKELQEITWKRVQSLRNMERMVKVRVNHIGQIVAVGEY